MTTHSEKATQAHQVLRRLADNASIIVWEADLEGRCIYINPECMEGLVRPEEINLKDWFEFVHPEDFAEAFRKFQQAQAERREYQVEYRIVRSDGSPRWMMGTAAPRLAVDGKLKTYVGTIVDVSERHLAQTKLTRSEAVHRVLTESARDLISYTDTDNLYVYVSPSHKDTLGYEPQELIGTNVFHYIHPDDLKPQPRSATSKRDALGGLDNIRFKHKNGSWVWLGASTRAIRDPRTGEKTGMVAIARDITAQLEAARELHRREERFRSLTSLSADWYWETDTELRFTFVSDGLYHRLGLDPALLLGLRLSAIVANQLEAGFVSCIQSMEARHPFRDLIFPVELISHPGTMRFVRVSGEPFSENGVFCGYRGVTSDVTKEVRTAKELERLATQDMLTELPNRALLETRLQQRLQGANTLPQAVFFIDLDNFKEVNDSLGHAAGDTLLKQIAARLRQSVRPGDIVARLGGDEFVVVAECKHGSTTAVRIAEKISAAIGETVLIDVHEINAAASIGVSLSPQDGETGESLLQNADTALYRAKEAGGKTYRFFTTEMGTASRERLRLQAALRHALERNEFEVYYQPRVDLKTLEMTGMEALLRWTHPEMGSISPAQFIPLAEEIGLIEDIGDWVLHRATIQTREWMTRYNRPLRISVNLSARQLRNTKLLASVRHALRASCLPPELLELELTETGLMEDPELAASLLKELKTFGLHLSVDDFGTGYSSLAYLCRFPLDCLKLDRSFLLQKHPEDVSPLKLAEAIINLAHALNLSVVAEGVETKEHLGFLNAAQCDEIQGFCISRPLPAAEFEKLIQRPTRALPVQDIRSPALVRGAA